MWVSAHCPDAKVGICVKDTVGIPLSQMDEGKRGFEADSPQTYKAGCVYVIQLTARTSGRASAIHEF